jgi:hypothetical protein
MSVACDHIWKRLRPVVRCIGETGAVLFPADIKTGHGSSTYNAQCEHCGVTTWVHWDNRRPSR